MNTHIKLSLSDISRLLYHNKTFLPPIDGDSDDVIALSTATLLEFFSKKHKIIDSHDGWIIIICPKTQKKYLHIINVPNKQSLLCRGCKETI
jgi:hypothetical protein